MKKGVTQMSDKELIQALRPLVLRDKFQCLGCGHEHRCSTHGCAIIKQVLERLEQLTVPEPNDPLTIDELREMDGAPVFVQIAGAGRYAVIRSCGEIFTEFTDGGQTPNSTYGSYWTAYRRKPEDGTP